MRDMKGTEWEGVGVALYTDEGLSGKEAGAEPWIR